MATICIGVVVLGGGLLLLPGRMLAQERAAGVVRDSASGAPIPGAVVTVTDSAGRVQRQVLTDGQGRFTVAIDGAWPGLRVIKLGFSPVELQGSGWHGNRSLDIRMAPFAFVLEAVETKARSICQADEGVAGVTASLWEQARAGLLAGVVARSSRPATATVASYHRVYDPHTDHLLSQWETRSSGRGQRAFGAIAPAQVLMQTGFVMDDGGTRQYFVPAAEVLLDPTFSTAHCFGIAPASNVHPGEIGLTFRPAPSVKHALPDVTGTLWLSVDPPELRSLVFQYVNIERSVEQAGAGGTLQYGTLGNGVVVLSKWSLVAPAVTHLQIRRSGAPVRVGDSVRQVDRIGGVLVHAEWPDGETYHATLGSIVGRVVRGDQADGTPASGIRVWIDSTPYATVTDSLGWFRIPDVLPASYTVRSRDVALAEFDVEDDLETKVEVTRTADTLPVQSLPTYTDIAERTCGRSRTSPTTTLLLGAMTLGGRAPEWPVDLSITWPGIGTSAVGHQTVTPESQGRFHVCGVPRGRVLSIRAQRGAAVWLDTVTTAPTAATGVVKLYLRPPGGP
jgi:hypothetical protein